MRNKSTLTQAARSLFSAVLPALALSAMAAPAAHAAEPADAAPWQAQLIEQAQSEYASFYAYRSGPLWIAHDGAPNAAAGALLDLIKTSHLDGLDSTAIGYGELVASLDALKQDSSAQARARAELAFSRTFATYVKGLRDTSSSTMLYEHDLLRPFRPETFTVLEDAAAAPSLVDYVQGMRWMHPLYGELRQAAMAGAPDASKMQAVRANLERLRALPASPGERYVLIDAASARLFMYEGGQVVDSMKVVVGTAETQTPIMSGYIRHAVFNPYWNVPTELLRKNIAPRARAQGQAYLTRGGYQVVSEWVADAEVLPSAGINWRAVETGELEIKMRQLPGGNNAMGKVKFEFPNPEGIYLHDTPDKSLMLKDMRQLSNGCIRLEDAARFGRWLLKGERAPASSQPEQKVELPQPVPIYVTYITAKPSGAGFALGPDPYSHDVARATGLAQADGMAGKPAL